MSALRENFSAKKLDFLKFDIPIMALTATATTLVCEDILNSLKMSKDPKIVLTSFFRPNLRFSVTSFSFFFSYEEGIFVFYTNERWRLSPDLILGIVFVGEA